MDLFFGGGRIKPTQHRDISAHERTVRDNHRDGPVLVATIVAVGYGNDD
jgi:hypothetical protein